MATTRKTSKTNRAAATRSRSEKSLATDAPTAPIVSLAQQLRSGTDSVLGIAGAAAGVSIEAAKAVSPQPKQRRALEQAGAVLRRMREAAGLSVREVSEAINLKDPALLDLVENGKVALPFEIILRLASVLGRNDPVAFVIRFTRTYNPQLWLALENLGIGRLALQAGREREFANLYRGSDGARRLSDGEFAKVLAFTKAAFELALAFRAEHAGERPQPSKSAKAARMTPIKQ